MTAKEKRLLAYLERCAERGIEPTVGDICRACCATPWTLLGKTWPGLREKLQAASQRT